jgi:hypothetical protein
VAKKQKKPTTMTYGAFAEKHGITLSAKEVDHNPQLTEEWPDGDHRLVTFKLGRKKFEVYFTRSAAFEGEPPSLSEVLCCVALDANTIESTRSFEEWCSEFGYDSKRDLRAFRTYENCKKQTERLKKFLGDEAYAALLACEEGE